MSDKVSLVRVLTAATGNSTPITLGARYSDLFMTPAEAGAQNGRTYTWLIVDGNDWELVKGAYTSAGTTMARTTVLASRIAGTLGTSRITLSGTAQVRIVEAAVDMDGVRGTRSVTGTSDTLASTDLGYAVTYSNAGAIAVSLAQAGTASLHDGWATWVQNLGVGTVTITPATSTVNGASTLVLATNMGAFIWSDGTNYHAYFVPVTKPLLAANNLSDVASVSSSVGSLAVVSYDAAQSLSAAQQAQARNNVSAVSGSHVNKFRNGTMDVWQRGTSALVAAATTVNGYSADGWIINATYSAGAGPVMSRVANSRTGARTQWWLKILGATNCTDVILKQRIEGAIAADFGTQPVTVQAQIRNDTGGSITPTITIKYPTATDNYASTTTDAVVSAVSLQACGDSAVTQVAYTFTPSGAVSLGMEISIDFGNNFSANTKAIYVGECDIRATPGAATGLNAVPPPPELRPVPVEMAICERYYWAGSGQTIWAHQANSADTGRVLNLRLPVTMRAVPTGLATWSSGTTGGTNSITPDTWSFFNSIGNTTASIYVSAFTLTAEI